MKRFLTTTAGMLCLASFAIAAPDMVEPAVWTAVPTNTGATASGTCKTNSTYTSAWLDAIVIDVGGTTYPTQTITVVTKGGTGGGPSRTLFTKSITADGIYYVRGLAQTTAGANFTDQAVRIPLVQEKIVVQAYGASTTTNTATVRVIVSPQP